MGRPTKLERRNRQLNLALSSSEFESIQSRARSVGMRPVHFCRAILLDQGRNPVAADRADNNNQRLIYGQLIRLGNNLNQIARHLHRHGGPVPHELEPLLRDIRRLIAKGFSQ